MSSSFTQPKYSIFTHSVGYHTANHDLLSKLNHIAAAGFQAIELFTDDLYQFSRSPLFSSILSSSRPLSPPDSPLSRSPASSSSSPSPISQQLKGETEKWYNAYGECTKEEAELELAAAEYIKQYCDGLGLEIACYQPMRDIEGWTGEQERREAMERVRSRFSIMRALGCELLLICSSNTPAPRTTGDLGRLVADFTLISDLASSFTLETSHAIKVGYEALSWGAHINLWSQAWSVVKTVNRPNIGLILDSFNTLAREYADPCSPTGMQEPATTTLSNLTKSIERIEAVPGDKIFLLQIGDAKRMDKPIEGEFVDGMPAMMIWSRSSRLYPCEREKGAFMPVSDFVKAVMNARYNGPWSIEVFNKSLQEQGEQVEQEHSVRARSGLDMLVEQVFS